MPLGQKDEMSQNTCDMEHNHLNIITPRLGIPDNISSPRRFALESHAPDDAASCVWNPTLSIDK